MSNKNHKKGKSNAETQKKSNESKIIVISIALAVLVCAVCVLLAFNLSKEDVDPSALVLEGEWMDIMTDSKIEFDGEGSFYLNSDGPYNYTYDETKQAIYIEYMGGYIVTLKCNYVNGYWQLSEEGRNYVPIEKRDEIRNQTVAEKWENHTKDRVEAVIGEEYTTANGIAFTITGGEMKNTPDISDSAAVINIHISCDTEINSNNWAQTEVRTPTDRAYGNTYFENAGEKEYIVTFYQNIDGVTGLGKEPHDYCILQFELGGTKYYFDLLKLDLIAE